jgi:predicted nucleic acid-binding protein
VRAVLDPNVLVSAAIPPVGPPAQILLAWADERFDLVISPQLLDELSEVLGREKFRGTAISPVWQTPTHRS